MSIFTPEPRCPNCDAELGRPSGYNENEDGVEFHCSMCGPMEAYHTVPVSDIPTEYLQDYYTFTKRINASLERDGSDPRFTTLLSEIVDELRERGEPTPAFDGLTHAVMMTKRDVMELDDDYPGISTIGSPPDDYEHTFGTNPSDIPYETFVHASELHDITHETNDDVTVEELS